MTSVIALRSRLTERQARSRAAWSAVVEQVGVAGGVERGQGARAAQGRHLSGVPELEELDRPLDVGESAAAELEVGVRVGAARQPLAVDARLDPLDLGDVGVGDARRAGSAAGRPAR